MDRYLTLSLSSLSECLCSILISIESWVLFKVIIQIYKTLNPPKISDHKAYKHIHNHSYSNKNTILDQFSDKIQIKKNTHRWPYPNPIFQTQIKNHQIFVTQSLNQPRPEPTKEEENDRWRFRCDSLPVVVAGAVGLVPLTFGTQT